MPSTSVSPGVFARMTTQRNLTILAAIILGVPTAYGFHAAVGGADLGGSFLLLVTLAVGVPTAYDEYWPGYDRTRAAVAWVVAACVVTTAAFIGLYLAGTELAGLPALHASVGAFLVTDLGGLALLSTRNRRHGSAG